MNKLTLTFDNGPSIETTPSVLDVLDQRGLHAWFCVIGKSLATPEAHQLVTETISRGHRIVNHSLTHRTPLGDDPSDQHAQREIVEMHSLMDDTLGDWGDRWFRPFGRGGELGPHLFSDASLATLTELSYSVLLWNSVPRDWEDPLGWVETALADVIAQDHTVLVLHDLPTGAMNRLPEFLDKVDQLGVEITNDVPDECVLMRSGEETLALRTALIELTPSSN
ncbi:MAG: polysaccharide deacetylase family protein [Actinomycetota bacterium]